MSAGGTPGFGKRELPAHTVVLTMLACAALVARRRAPMTVLALVSAISVLELLLGTQSHPPSERHASLAMTVVIAVFTVAMRTDRHTTFRVAAVTVAAFIPVTMLLGAQPWYTSENLGTVAWLGLAATLGEAVRTRRAIVDAIRERAERAERTREEEARRRVAEERLRIARELHDVVAHHIALVNVQAGVAAHVMDTRPDQAKEALGHIRQASRRALGELQSTVGLLRQQDEPIAPTEPARGLAVLEELVDGFTRAGMSVAVHAPAAEASLPSAVDLAAYRVVQEALTNVHKHAGAESSARVRIVRRGVAVDPVLDIVVEDDGPVPERVGAAPAAALNGSLGSGHGLTGMRERAVALGGTCETGPRDGGGFRVRVTLPLNPPRAAEPEAGEPAARRAGWCG
ncbi:two-component sensor histidine kinase [Streptomyces sp. 8K308]|nr:two-component sensor histidine kinase [Streptomyces sp. 8K308]